MKLQALSEMTPNFITLSSTSLGDHKMFEQYIPANNIRTISNVLDGF